MSDASNNMPARIWVDEVGGDFPVAYHRADIVERMAEALADISTNSHHPWSARIASAALNSYREATNDKA